MRKQRPSSLLWCNDPEKSTQSQFLTSAISGLGFGWDSSWQGEVQLPWQYKHMGPIGVENIKYLTSLSSVKNKSVFLSEHSFHLEGDKYEMWVIYVSADIPTDNKFPLTEFQANKPFYQSNSKVLTFVWQKLKVIRSLKFEIVFFYKVLSCVCWTQNV